LNKLSNWVLTTIPTPHAVLISHNGFRINITLSASTQSYSSSSSHRISRVHRASPYHPHYLKQQQHMALSSHFSNADGKKPMTNVSRLFSYCCWLYLDRRIDVHTTSLSFPIFTELYRPPTPRIAHTRTAVPAARFSSVCESVVINSKIPYYPQLSSLQGNLIFRSQPPVQRSEHTTVIFDYHRNILLIVRLHFEAETNTAVIGKFNDLCIAATLEASASTSNRTRIEPTSS